ncbi:MAG: hypothetical protein KJ921_04305 [Proteobacteria bacterium]|nr:hypothetical protein [Pseudomonadota bacterium]
MQKSVIMVGLLLALLLVAVTAAWAATGFAGYWVGTWTGPSPDGGTRTGEMQLQLSYSGSTLVGNFKLSNTGEGPVWGEMDQSTVSGNSFTGTGVFIGSGDNLTMKGTLNGDTLTGGFNIQLVKPGADTYTFTLQRGTNPQ